VSGINMAGVKAGTVVQNLTVAGKVAALLGVTALAFFAPAAAVSAEAAAQGPKPASSIALTLMACLVPAFFAYGGWQQALWISGEVKNPRRTLPVAILAGTGLVVVVYLLVNWAYLSMLGVEKVATSKSLAADAVATVFPAWGGRAIAAAVAVSAFGVLNAQLLTGPRLIQALAADGRFWRVFARVSGPRSTPVPAIALLGGLSAAVLAAAGHERVDQISAGVVVVDGISFILTAAAVFWLTSEAKGESGDKPLPGSRVAAGLFVLGEIGLVIGAHADEGTRRAAWIGLAWMLAAVVLFVTVFARGGRQHPVSNDATNVS
jgi:basic amino acid/polyamine antiporter, APA family